MHWHWSTRRSARRLRSVIDPQSGFTVDKAVCADACIGGLFELVLRFFRLSQLETCVTAAAQQDQSQRKRSDELATVLQHHIERFDELQPDMLECLESSKLVGKLAAQV